ncbi:MAG: cytochrome b5-like heme/steroid binding domain-containing protein [Acidimicrobiales bacterium]
MASHNNNEQGWWMTINGRVYDVSEFSHMHPGGRKIIRSYAGSTPPRPTARCATT